MAAPAPASAIGDDLRWLDRLLWPDHPTGLRPGRGPRGALTFLTNPSPGDCHLLVPTGDRVAAARSVNRYHDAAGLDARARMLAVETALRFGAGRAAQSRLVHLPPDRDRCSLVTDVIGRELGVTVASFAVTLGPRRYNRKPVIQMFDGAGWTVGFAKLGADAVTDELVAHETAWLRRAAGSRAGALRVAPVLWAGEWAGHPVSVTAPAWGRRLRGPRRGPADAALLTAICELGANREAPLSASAPVRALTADTHPWARRVVAALQGRDAIVRLGAWHGDLTPWNMLTDRVGTVVIDWEMAGDDMPFGADAVLRTLSCWLELDRIDPRVALTRLVGANDALLAPLKVGPDAARATLDAVLAELVRRDLRLEAAGTASTGLGRIALEALEGDTGPT